jgi:CheY-like chemotaxis protein/chemotaxis signal transduction protein
VVVVTTPAQSRPPPAGTPSRSLRVLLVDDSEAILELEQAALSRHYQISLARNGAEALARVAQERPDGILLDLSMPDMDGDEVLDRLKRDPRTAAVPVLIVSSEAERADACLDRGAHGALHKPVSAGDLVAAVGRMLEEVQASRRQQGLAILPLRAGPLLVAIPLHAVRGVYWMASTAPLPGAPAFVAGALELRGEPVVVVDLATRFGVAPAAQLLARKLVVLEGSRGPIALCVDQVLDPEEVPPDRVFDGALEQGRARGAVRSVLRSVAGLLPLLEAELLLGSRSSLDICRELFAAVEAAA